MLVLGVKEGDGFWVGDVNVRVLKIDENEYGTILRIGIDAPESTQVTRYKLGIEAHRAGQAARARRERTG